MKEYTSFLFKDLLMTLHVSIYKMHIIYKMDCKLDLEVILPFPRNLTFYKTANVG